MFIGFPHCDFKCDRENGNNLCQNSHLVKLRNKLITSDAIVNSYIKNDVTSAIVIGGLEPFEDFEELLILVQAFREKTLDDIVIYTGFNKEEKSNEIQQLQRYPNIIIKFGRFIPGHKPHYDPVLGIELASDNQYAEKIS